ncbi:MAG: hypothetical protein LQ349_001113 [Xanthoria aureola]|nr:MAG: hypothetical protein LQ349_001113 [Xanthoria aureola]
MSPSHLEALTQVTRHFAKLGEYNLDSGARLHSSRKRRRSRSSQRIPSPEQGSGSGAGKPYQPTVKDVSDKDDIDQRPIKKIREDLTPTVNGKTTSPSTSNSTPPTTSNSASPSTSNSTSPSKSKQAARKQKATKKPTRKDGSGTRKVPARSKASITKCSVWKPILRLENIELDRAAKQYLTEHGINAAPLFADCRPLENEVLGFNGGETSGDAFAAHFKYTVTLEDRRSVDTIRLFFQLLMWYDLVKIVAPRRTGKKIGKIMLEDIQGFIEPNKLDIESKLILSEVQRWTCLGWKLNVFCETFGPGSLLHLGPLLTLGL